MLTLAGILEGHAGAAPDRLALRFGAQQINYGALWRQVENASGALHAWGVRPGDRVAWLGLNDPAMLLLLFALARIGAMLAPLNYRLAAAEHAAILQHAQAQWLVADSAHTAVARALAESLGLRLHGAPELQQPWPAAPGSALPGAADAPVLLVHTSGSTGQSKAALHTQGALLANCEIAVEAFDMQPGDHVLSALPLFHVGGLCIQTLPALQAGASVTLHPRFEAGAWLADVQALRPSMALLVPAALRALLAHPGFTGADLSSLRLLGAGSSIIPQGQISAMHARGVPVCQVYGATETGPVSICLAPQDALARAGSAGRAAPRVRVRLVGADAIDVADGSVGEIWLQGPNLMRGYWREGGADALADGWFHSGDLARRDPEGFYWVVGRNKDMLISGGENIYPAELENILADCPDIEEAAVFGQADAHWGEVPIAVVVPRIGVVLDEAQVLALFDGRVARFKHPRRVLFAQALPRTALGKVRKAALRELFGA